MKSLSDSVSIRNLNLKNRFVRSATYDGLTDKNGFVSDSQIDLFRQLAQGGVGLIISGIVSVHSAGRLSAFMSTLDNREHFAGLKRLVDTVHQHGAKIAPQLFHAGREASFWQQLQAGEAVAPSVIENDPYFEQPYRALTEDEILQIIEAFGLAAQHAREIGYDAVQVHSAHAYLFAQFLSPFTNRRSDAWGGSLENRLRFHREVYKSIRSKVGDDYPIMVKLGVQDNFPEGLHFKEGKQAAVQLCELGFDAIEVSSGLRGIGYKNAEYRPKINSIEKEGYFRDFCREIHHVVKIPTIVVGGLRSIELMEDIVARQEADLVSLCRPLIREPNLVQRWQNGDRSRATCISCNGCHKAIMKGPLFCAVEAKKSSVGKGIHTL